MVVPLWRDARQQCVQLHGRTGPRVTVNVLADLWKVLLTKYDVKIAFLKRSGASKAYILEIPGDLVPFLTVAVHENDAQGQANTHGYSGDIQTVDIY